MDLKEALKQLPHKKQYYFKWRNDYNFRSTKTEDDIKKVLGVQALTNYVEWESSAQYQYLMNLLIQSKIAKDLQEIYESTSEKARTGDEKSIKVLFEIQKQIVAMNKQLATKKPETPKTQNSYDELEM